MPATGPVGDGGDQGRDFETYRTYLHSTPIATSTFLGAAKNKKIVFACSLQQDIVKKIRSDISTICGGPERVDTIYYFCEASVPVGRRHKLQQWSEETFQTELEVFDGEALSEQLTDLDVFWIAEEYLDVPSELYPRPTKPSSTYDEYRQRWLIQDETPYSYSDFSQVKYGLRRATFRVDAKPDLQNWLGKMEVYIDEKYPMALRRRAIYEVCVAALRGRNNLTEKKNLVEDYFSQIEKLQMVSDIQDATTLLSYCSSAHLHGHFEVDVDKLFDWTKSLIARIEKALDEATGSGALCRLLQIRGQAGYLQFSKGTRPEISLDETFEWWFRLLDEVEKTPLFPLEDFADLLTIMTQIVGEDARFLDLTRKIDELLSDRSSGYIAAEKCRDRALAYYDAGKYILAIKQLHQAKIKWFSAETLRGSLMSMLLLSDCYQRLNLVYPAKYYAACVAFLSSYQDDDDTRSFIPRGLFMLAESCYHGGECLTFAQISRWAIAAHNMYDERPLEIERHGSLQRIFVYTAIMRTVTKRLDENLAQAFEEVFSQWPIDSATRDGIEGLSEDETGFWHTVSIDELRATSQDQLADRPFCDVGRQRRICWNALGIEWAVEFDNEYLVSAISEELVSTLQIILADLAHSDLVLLPNKVLVTTDVIDDSRMQIEEVPSNEIATWRVGIPRSWIGNLDVLDDLRGDILALAVTILGNCSALDDETLTQQLERAFSEGLPVKTFAVRPYAELYMEFLPKNEFYSLDRKKLNPLFSSLDFVVAEHEQLAWNDTDGPGYSKERAREFLTNRYTHAIKPIRLTLPRLLRDDGFRRIIGELRPKGYLEWEILIMVANICVEYRARQFLPPQVPFDELGRIVNELMYQEESEDDINVPPSVFTGQRIEIQEKVLLAAVAKTWDLEIRQTTPDFDALEKLLDVRYHNSEDDIEHEELFGSA